MWPRGRMPPPQGRGSGIPGSNVGYPPTLGFNQYPQPQQGGFRNQQQNFYRPNKRDRLRPRQQGYSFYSDDSGNSNYSNKTAGSGSRGSNQHGGSGIVNAAMSNLPPKPPLSDKRDNNNRKNERGTNKTNDRTDRQRTYSQSQYIENRSQNKIRLQSETGSQHRMYFCPKCGDNYSYRHTQNKYIGKIPLILHCNHTMCQECIYQNLKNYKVSCPSCQNDSILTQEETPVCQSDMQNVFPPNFYVIGVISYYRPQGGFLGNLDGMKFVSSASKKTHTFLDPSDSCCFATCSKPATMYCPSCEGIYCIDCCTVVHKSTKKLMSHEPVLRRKEKFSLMLENCGDHAPMQVEFFCKTCDLTACCYCVLDKHTDHERVPLFHLNETEMEEFKRLKKVAERALREVLHTQKKAARFANFNTGSVKKDVCQYFADYHANIESLEKKMFDELETFKNNNRGLDAVQSSLMVSAEQLKQLVAFNEDKIGDNKLNLRGALDKLRDIINIPRFLLNDNGTSEPVRFVVNTSSIDALKEAFTIEKCEDSEYQLVSEKDLPDDYVIDLDDSDSEVDGNISAIINRSRQSDDLSNIMSKLNDLPKMVSVSATNIVQRHVKPTEPQKKKLGTDMQKVDVQHINSMDSFFIQYKSNQSKLVQLNKDIENYVKMGGAQLVEEPQLNVLYLALYLTDSRNQKEQKWCRARLTDIKESESGPLYEMFFIDYGKTQIVEANRIRDMPTFLAQKKPFAIECMLHNPMSVNWNKKAHYHLAKILNGKEVYMIVKALNGGIHEVDLMIASSDGGVTSVTDILVHAHQSVEPRSDDNTSLDGSLVIRKEGYFPTLKVFPNSKKFAKNQKEKVTIANVVDPDNIFIHLVQHHEAFKTMNHAIKKAFRNAKTSRCIPIEGTYVLAEHKDAIRSNWHRAFIKSVDLDSEKVQVLLVDWGINVVVPSSSIRALQESFTKLESQAVLVTLAHIAPYSAQATWPPHAANFLQGFHQSQDVLKMVVHDVEHGVQVALFDVTGNVDLCINAMMVENNLADSTGPISTKLEWPHFEVKNPTFSEEDGLMASMLKKVDEQADEESGDDEHPEVRKRQVDVIKAEAPDLIWVKFLEFKERESAMFRELQIHYSEEQQTKSKWNIGDQCVAVVEHEFARGRILEEVSGEYKVYLYDKVKEVTVPLDMIFIYDKYFMKYPQAVIRSHLAFIKPAGDTGKWSISSAEALQEIFLKHKRIYGNKAPESDTGLSTKSLPLDMWYGVVKRGGPLDPDKMKYTSINNSLVKLGFAYKVPRPITPKPSTSVVSTSPVKASDGGEYLLKVLTGGITNSSEEMYLLEADKEKRSATAKSPEQAKSTDKTMRESSTKKKKSARKDGMEKTQCMKILESLNRPHEKRSKRKQTIEPTKLPVKVDGTEEKKTEEQLSESEKAQDNGKAKRNVDGKDAIKNWNTIVEEELGDPSVTTKTSEELEGLGSGAEDNDDSPYHKTEVVIDDWLPSLRLTKNDFQARVTCVETCGHLYIHEEAMDEVYNKMEANIKEYFDKNPPEVSDHQWQPGQLCTIKFTEGNWYRGKILRIKNPKEISVFMIDFGSDHDLSPDVLFREVLYTDIGAFATKVKLEKVYTKSGSWLSSDYDHFHEIVTDWCRIVVKGPLNVEVPLVDVYNDNGVFVNQKLIELCPNLSRCSNFPMEQGVDEEDMVVIESIENVENEEPFADEMLMDNFNRELDKAVTTTSDDSIENFDVTSLKYRKRVLPEVLLKGKQVLLEIGGVLDHDKVALKTPGADVSEEMYNLVLDIQDIVDTLPPLKEFEVGKPCLAPFSEDGIWYRARIYDTKALDMGFVDVLFVDYGNTEVISVKKVRQIISEYLKVPQQTWEASLNFVLEDESHRISVIQFMKTLDRKKRYIKMVKEDPLIVDIFDKEGELSYQTFIDNGSIKSLQQEDAA